MSLVLVSAEGDREIELPEGHTLVVGRSGACDLPVYDATISRRHAEVEVEVERLRVRDLGSTNGTTVGGRRLGAGQVEVAAPGEAVVFGQVVFELRLVAPTLPEPPEVPEGTIIRRLPVGPPVAGEPEAGGGPRESVLAPPVGGTAHERQSKRLALLLEIAKELAQQPEVDSLLAKVVDITSQIMDVDRVSVLMLGSGGELTPRVARSRLGGGDGGAAAGYVPRSIARRAVAEKIALLTDNAAADERFNAHSMLLNRVESAMCVPMVGSEGRVLGLLYVDNVTSTHSFDDEDLEFLVAFSGIAAVSIENSQLVERARREAVVLSNFQRYFAPDLAREIAAHPGEVQLGGEKRPAVILFSDIRGFTRLSEGMSPEEIATLLNEYYTEMVAVVFEHGGMLDKFIGDALMALWGAPIPDPAAADRAVAAALAMLRALDELNRAWEAQGRPRLEVGIGINLGEVFAGNIGSARRLEYTVLGDAVNTAARLCQEAGPGEVLISAPLCAALASRPQVDELAPLKLKGKADAVAVFRLRSDAPASSRDAASGSGG